MALINIVPNGTPIPKLDPKLLPDHIPQAALNMSLKRGSLTPLRGPYIGDTLTQLGDLVSIYKLKDLWLAWTVDTDVVKAQVADSDDRFYYADGQLLKQSYYTEATGTIIERTLSIYPPSSTLTVTLAGSSGAGDPKVVSYVYTYVGLFGEESAPSPPSPPITVPAGQYVSLSNFHVSGNAHVTSIRVYRLEVGSSGSAEYQLIESRPVTLNSSYTDYTFDMGLITSTTTPVYDANDGTSPTDLTSNLGEVIPSEDWDPAPSACHSLVQFQNGVLVAASGEVVAFSEAGVPYAFPLAYRKTLDYDVVALGVFGSNLIALTTGTPYLMQGTDPSRMSLVPLGFKQGCLSKRGAISTEDAVIYPSPDGLFKITSTNGYNLTEHLFTREQWNDPDVLGGDLSDLIGVFYDGSYYGFFEGTDKGFILTLNEETPRWMPFRIDVPVYDAVVDDVTNTLHLLGYYLDDHYHILHWGQGAPLSAFFTSKIFTAHPTNMGVFKLMGEFGDGVSFEFYGDNVKLHTDYLLSENFFWLAESPAYRTFYFRLVTNGNIVRVLADYSPENLNNG